MCVDEEYTENSDISDTFNMGFGFLSSTHLGSTYVHRSDFTDKLSKAFSLLNLMIFQNKGIAHFLKKNHPIGMAKSWQNMKKSLIQTYILQTLGT